jgi:hypothetical protein
MIVVILSVELFWGWKMEFDSFILSLTQKEQEMIVLDRAKLELTQLFNLHNLQLLVDKVKEMKVHLHNPLVEGENYACGSHH